MAYADQVAAVEKAVRAAIAETVTAFPVRLWGDNASELKSAPVAAYVHAEAETPATLARQIVRCAVTVRSAATADPDRSKLEAACAAVEAATPGDLTLQQGAAVAPQGWGPLELTADQFLVRSLTLRVFVHF